LDERAIKTSAVEAAERSPLLAVDSVLDASTETLSALPHKYENPTSDTLAVESSSTMDLHVDTRLVEETKPLSLWKKPVLGRFLMAVTLHVLQQVSGINIIVSFSGKLLNQWGFSRPGALFIRYTLSIQLITFKVPLRDFLRLDFCLLLHGYKIELDVGRCWYLVRREWHWAWFLPDRLQRFIPRKITCDGSYSQGIFLCIVY
jgi:hypothetical protein